MALLVAGLIVPAIVVAQDEPPTVPTPAPDQIVLTGLVPAPPGTTVRLMVVTWDAAANIIYCDETMSEATKDNSPDVSKFVLVLSEECLADRVGAGICWTPYTGDCALYLVHPDQLGQSFDTGLLESVGWYDGPQPPPPLTGGPAPIQPNPPDSDLGPEVLNPATEEQSQVTGLPETGTLGSSRQPRSHLLTWAGVAALVMGLGLGVSASVAARRR